MGCITFAIFAIMINGSPPSFFKWIHGLSHGFPLSPLLFFLVIEELNKLIDDVKEDKRIKVIKISYSIYIYYLFFVDDILMLWIGVIF